ncbi:MAG TPA: hypothetical protein VIX37_08255, partial [Candidatus Sulfotelmatobacter sp.]
MRRRTLASFLRHAAFLLVNGWAAFACAQSDADVTTKRLFEQERWQQLVGLAPTVALHSAEFEYEYGVALGHLERWDEARAALTAGSRLAPQDKRFPIELAGVAFKQKKQGLAIAHLRRALRLDPKDAYSNEFIATLYFLQGNV